MTSERDMLRALVADFLEAWQDEHGADVCDCGHEEYNRGESCVACRARAVLADPPVHTPREGER